ncbi:beta-ketoacyl-[acyl-carrier-protein] synthase family protein [Paractinoplanes rishiriensis]|uniref:Beta-ketoacyl synthase n=1 Tax=Paractinoplanes rishiriensis TaxID=1050105 RepID=A0A919MW99_9ACTN|nr:beta-ketoacyl synthase N-terminal-like domain-containing protein [Actinoplanes rishiriensis]GIF02262.1 beta-ketoacyl synthase [Actinoplanes rishiriensis]
MTEVVVTGLGAVTCHGTGVGALLAAVAAGRAATPDKLADDAAYVGAPLIHAVPGPVGEDGRRRAGAFAATAAVEALRQAGLTGGGPGRGGLGRGGLGRVGVVLGTCLGDGVAGTGPDDVVYRVAATLGELLGRAGRNVSVSNACAAGGFAAGIAADLIRAGEADVVLTGGADAYSRVGWASMDRLGALDDVRCRPFDRDRRGTVLGEGAGVLVLESAAHAAGRGATVLARLLGDGWSCDAGHLTAPEPDGTQIVRAITGALGDNRAVGAVIPHATGTPHNDRVESVAVREVLGADAARTPLYSLKPLIGHTGGASAALAAIVAVDILRSGTVPANAPVENPDPECEVYLPQDGPTPLRLPRVLVNAYAFGGNNSSTLWGCAA